MYQNASKERLKILDGLRFLAVGSVVLYHVYPGNFPGGYIGVDIFFLISGFIIYLKYSEKLLDRDVSFRSFFVRRVRRLLPAYLVFIVITSLLAFAFLPPSILKNYAEVLVSNGIYLQNHVLFAQGDYFFEPQSRALLHTWSLAVEEQFYLIFPLFIILLRRFRSVELALILLLILGSALLAIQFSSISSRLVFYTLPFRAWEFGVGFLAAYIYRRDLVKKAARPVAEVCGLSGIIMISFSVFGFTETAVFPGPHSFLALTGTFLLCIFQNRLSGSVWLPITNNLSQHFGHISYSWYLWHWPFISFYYIYTGSQPQGLAAAGILILGYLAGALSYQYVERISRPSLIIHNGKKAASSVLLFGALTLSIGLFFIKTNGAVFRYDPAKIPYVIAQSSDVGERCGFVRRIIMFGSSVCQRAYGSSGMPILLIGDSHSNMLRPLLTQMANEADRPLYVTTDICRPTQMGNMLCTEAYWQQLRRDIAKLKISSVVIIARWPIDFTQDDYEIAIARLSDLGLDIFLLQSLPESEAFSPTSSSSSIYGDVRSRQEVYATYNRQSYLNDRTSQILAFENMGNRDNITILWTADVMCPVQSCLFAKDGAVIYMDDDHLSEAGAKLLRPSLEPIFE
ncbi:MAG TPA: hypothetical protein DCE52_09250 [Rhodobacteraceae bacterium]|nr:hypothetical protein [Paracoccaceae bacterium]